MIIEKFPKAFYKVVDVLLVLSLIAASVIGCAACSVACIGFSAIIGGILGAILCPIAVYLFEVLVFTPMLCVISILFKLDKKLGDKV